MLSARSSWRGLWLVAHCWGAIALATLMGVLWPLTLPLAVMIVGTRQLGLISRASLQRKVLRDLSGQTFYKQCLAPLLDSLKGCKTGEPAASPLARNAQELARGRRFLLGNALGFAVFAAAGWWWVWLLMWLLPMATWLPLVTRIRNIAEHALVGRDQADPLRQARTTHAGFVERALLAPHWVNCHLEHHLFTQVPCWKLPQAHALLRRHRTHGSAAGLPYRAAAGCSGLSVSHHPIMRLCASPGLAGWKTPSPRRPACRSATA